MTTILSISILVALVLWAGLALASFLGKLVADILPFSTTAETRETEKEDYAMVA